MRIIGGKYRGRRVEPPKNFKARPTTDFAREGLFNILDNRIDFEKINVLDLFSGTGCMSYEFASRGVPEIHLVEKDYAHISGIKRIIRELEIDTIRTIHIDVKAYLKTCSIKYNIVFADPPYDLQWLNQLPDLILGAGIIKEDGFLILEHPKTMRFNDHPLFFEHRNYGGVNFSLFKPRASSETIDKE